MPNPPLNIPVIQKPTPIALDETLVETTDSNKALYDRELQYGHLHPDRIKYPGYRFLKSEPTTYGMIRYYWGNDFTAQDFYNVTKTYAEDAILFPTFVRSYRVLREDYLVQGPLTKLTAFTGIVAIRVTAGGSGYTQDFAATLTGGGGTGAAATCIVDTQSGAVIWIFMTNVGSGYTAAPAVGFGNGDGTGAAASAIIQPATALLTKEEHSKLDESDPYASLYDRVTRTWETLPGPIISGTQIDPESGIVIDYEKQVVAAGSVTSGKVGSTVLQLLLQDGGTGYTSNPTVTISGGGGTGATATASITAPSPAGQVASIALTNPGIGFTMVPAVAISDTGGGSGSGATAAAVLNGVQVASLVLDDGGSGFTDVPLVQITDAGTGAGATGVATLTPTTVEFVNPVNAGSGYTTATVTFSGGGGTGADVSAVIVGGAITSYNINNNGSGYTSIPTATVSGDGTGATAVVLLNATSVASIALTSTGSHYQNPSVAFVTGGGTATAHALLQPTSIQSVTVTAPGAAYTSPAVTIAGGGGGAAIATAALLTGTVTTLSLTNAGSGFTSSPSVSFSGGGGTGAQAAAIIGALTYVYEEPVTSVKSIKMSSSVDLSSLPPDKSYPVTFRVQFQDLIISSLVEASGSNGVDFGMLENGFNGGSGPVAALMWERYMTDSEYEAFGGGPYSVTGKTVVTTLVETATSNGYGRVWTFRPTPAFGGTTAGTVDLSADILKYGIRKVRQIALPRNY